MLKVAEVVEYLICCHSIKVHLWLGNQCIYEDKIVDRMIIDKFIYMQLSPTVPFGSHVLWVCELYIGDKTN